MYSRMLPQSLGSAVWVVSPNTFAELATMALSVGTGGGPIWLNNGVQGPPATILGRPVVISEKVSALGNEGDVNFIDFSYYLVGDRQAMTVSSSEHFRFQNGETSFKFVERLDGRPWLQSALTPRNGGDTLTPFVSLAERA
jgi:HK97 family phage major capsid protein